MKISFDGLRENATVSMNELSKAIKAIVENDSFDDIKDRDKKELIGRFNEAAMFVDSFNCIFDDNDKDDINDLSHLEIEVINEDDYV